MTDDPPLADPEEVSAEKAETSIEHAARRSFGLRARDRAEVYRETAEAATDADLAFWAVLLLSGAIATLGLALNATAVVIGAMLVAPLLGPLLGLAMAFAVGDGRLAVQTGLTVILGTAGVIALAALLTFLLPFQNVTSEIAARTRPTTIDLGIAVFSGLAGAVVTLSRESRLSASIPGVAIAVALIPPMGVAGFALGTGGDWPLFKGSMLLFGANLAGIVLSATLAFMLVGMHRPDVVEAAREWHRSHSGFGLSAEISRTRLYGRLRVFGSPMARVVMVAAFVGALAIPLTTSLQQVLREQRVNYAIEAASRELTDSGAVSVLSRDVTLNEARTAVHLRIATREWVGADLSRRFEEEATARAGEPVSVVLEQVIAANSHPGAPDPLRSSREEPLPVSLDAFQGRLSDALAGVVLPEGVRALGGALLVGEGPPAFRVTYAAPRPLSDDAAAVVAGGIARSLGLPPDAVRLEPILTALRLIPPSDAAATALADTLARFPGLGVLVLADSATAAEAQGRLLAAGVPGARLRTLPSPEPRLQYFLRE